MKQFTPVSCLIAGGNLYDKILRQKDKLFEEETPSRFWLLFLRKETSNKEAVYSCFLNALSPHHDSLWAFFPGSITAD